MRSITSLLLYFSMNNSKFYFEKMLSENINYLIRIFLRGIHIWKIQEIIKF